MTDSKREATSILFVDFLLRVEAGDGVEFETFCAEHPGHAPGLRRRKRNLDRVSAAFQQLRADSAEPQGPETFLVKWLEAVREGRAAAFDELCAAHPAVADELAELYSGLRDVLDVRQDALEQALGLDPPVAEALREQPRPSTGEDRLNDLLARLEQHRPAMSKYEFVDEVAAGGMGAIQEIQDVDLRRTLARKTILPARRRPELVGRFVEEAQVTAQLAHPGVVPVHELGVDESGEVFFSMALVEGRELGEVYADAAAGREGWSTTRVVELLLRVCETVAYAHSMGVIHRDLKPANVMVGDFGQVYVMDWGLAKVLRRSTTFVPPGSVQHSRKRVVSSHRRDESDLDPLSPHLTQEGTAAGTPAFMSPEQARGEVRTLDERSDVYALGALLYTLLSGMSPFDDVVPSGEGARVVQALLKGPPTSLVQVAPAAPAELVAIADKAMHRDPEDRYANATEVATDLRAYLEMRVVAAYESGPWASLRKWVRRNRRFATALGAAALAVVGGLGGTAYVEARGRAKLEVEQARTDRRTASLIRRGLRVERDELWPAVPANLERIQGWLERARTLLADRERHEQWLRRVGAPEVPDIDWERDLIREHLDALAPVTAWIGDMEVRERLAESLEVRTVIGESAWRRWSAALAAISQSEVYEGLELEPVLGLLPLRSDPESGYWEFWHVLSGAEPKTDPATGRWTIFGETGMVFVLLPGGRVTVGAIQHSADDPLYDPFQSDRNQDERPVHTVQLDPFLISKYEMTQGQWLRVSDSNPSQFEGLALPVERVTWAQSCEALTRFGLELPTEAQWEYACRAGTETLWSTGQKWATLAGFANIYEWHYRPSEDVELEGWDDGFVHVSAPVGTYRPNPMGLHDMHGNVWEWCRDYYDAAGAPRAGDGLRTAGDPKAGVLRGGSWFAYYSDCRTTNRLDWTLFNAEPDVGFRAVWNLR